MFLRGDIIIDGSGLRRCVIWADKSMRLLATTDATDETEWPELFDGAVARELCGAGTWSVIEGPTTIFPNEADIPPNHREQRDRLWAMVSELFENNLPGLFNKKQRTGLIREAAARHETSEVTIRKHVLRGFHRGMVADALLPDWGKCGAPGVERPAEEDGRKRGRPVADGHPEGTNVLPDVRRMMQLAADEFERNHKLTFDGAYRHFARLFFAPTYEELREKLNGNVPLSSFADCGLPTYQQFSYWVRKDRSAIEAQRKRVAARVWDMANRPLLSNSNKDTWGPGGRYQIDATILDVYVRSRRNRNLLVGRPTLYVVIDTFSRMIVGIYVGLENASWVAAMMALANASASKVEFCRKYGIEIAPEDWPCRHIPAVLLGDNGEIKSAGVDNWLKRIRVVVDNAAAYRADWKGIVEARFRILQATFAPYVPGYVEADFRQRGARDYRLDAVLDIDDVTRIVIRQILYYNNVHELAGYHRHTGLSQDGVPSVPREIWNWGIARLSGEPRKMDEKLVRFALMPTETASVHREGIYFHGNHYTCPFAMEHDWFVKAKKKRFPVTISYDKRNADEIFVHINKVKDGFQAAALTPACRDRVGMDHHEMEAMIRSDAVVSAQRRTGQTLARAVMEGEIEAEVDRATEAFGDGPTISDRAQTAGTRERRAVETAVDRELEAGEFSAPISPIPRVSKNVGVDGAVLRIGVTQPPDSGVASFGKPTMSQIRARLQEAQNG